MPLRIRPEVQALPRRLTWGVLAVAAVGGLALLGRGGITDPPPVPEPAPNPTPAVADGEWAALGDAPVTVPGEHRGVWTGSELVVAGHHGELAVYDGEWRRASPSPVALGHAPFLFWTGEEVVALAGTDDGQVRALGVAAYRPDDDRWRALATLGAPLRDTALAVWADGRLYAWDRTRGLMYVAEEDRWVDIPRVPVGWDTAAAVAAGDQVVVYGERSGAPFAAAYLQGGTWTRPRRPWLNRPQDAAAVWTGEELLLWGRPRLIDGEQGPPAGFAYDPDTAQWRWLPDAPTFVEHAALSGVRGVWTGDRAVFVGAVPGRGVGLVLHGGAWSRLPPGGGARLNPVLAWTGSELLVWGGYTTTGPAVDLVSWRPS